MTTLVPTVSPLSGSEIDRMANNIVLDFCPGHLQRPGAFPVLDFFDHYLPNRYRLETGVEELGDGIEGLTFPDGRVLVSEETYRQADRGIGRARFTIVHEGFHGIQHRDQIRIKLVHTKLVLHRRQSIPAYRDPEWQANRFAAAVLMPATQVANVIQRIRFDVAGAMATTFQVSRTCAEVRMKQLGIE